MIDVRIDRDIRVPTSVQLALAVMIGTLAGGIIILDLPLKWKAALIIAIGFASAVAVVRSTKSVLLLAVALMIPFSVGTGLPAILAHPQHIGLSGAVFIQLVDVLILALLLGHLARMATHQAEFRVFPSITVPALVWVFASALSAENARDPTLSLIQIFHMCRLLISCVVLANVLEEPKHVNWLLIGLLLGTAFQGLLGTYQALAAKPAGLEFLGEASDAFPLGLDEGVAYRASGTIGHPNGYATYLSTTLPLAVAIMFSRPARAQSVLAGTALGIGGLGLVFSLSRGGWIAFALAFLLVLSFAVKLGRVSLRVALGVGLVATLVLLGLELTNSDLIASRFRSDDRGSATSRLTQAQGALAMLRDYPATGIGLNNWSLRVREYGMASVVRYNGLVIVHNIYLLIAAETGIIGLLAFLWLLSALLVHAWRFATHPAPVSAWVTGAGLLAGFVALMVHGLADYDLLANLRVFGLFWLLAAMAVSIDRLLASESQAPRSQLQQSMTSYPVGTRDREHHLTSHIGRS